MKFKFYATIGMLYVLAATLFGGPLVASYFRSHPLVFASHDTPYVKDINYLQIKNGQVNSTDDPAGALSSGCKGLCVAHNQILLMDLNGSD